LFVSTLFIIIFFHSFTLHRLSVLENIKNITKTIVIFIIVWHKFGSICIRISFYVIIQLNFSTFVFLLWKEKKYIFQEKKKLFKDIKKASSDFDNTVSTMYYTSYPSFFLPLWWYCISLWIMWKGMLFYVNFNILSASWWKNLFYFFTFCHLLRKCTWLLFIHPKSNFVGVLFHDVTSLLVSIFFFFSKTEKFSGFSTIQWNIKKSIFSLNLTNMFIFYIHLNGKSNDRYFYFCAIKEPPQVNGNWNSN
jgi:hypothetical protein